MQGGSRPMHKRRLPACAWTWTWAFSEGGYAPNFILDTESQPVSDRHRLLTALQGTWAFFQPIRSYGRC
jgi:hypothetical protein